MEVMETKASEVPEDVAKTPMNRLLDMVAGWSNYAQEPEEAPDAPGMIDRICDLYQKTGEVAFKEYTTAEEEDAAIREFLVSEVLPVLVNRA